MFFFFKTFGQTYFIMLASVLRVGRWYSGVSFILPSGQPKFFKAKFQQGVVKPTSETVHYWVTSDLFIFIYIYIYSLNSISFNYLTHSFQSVCRCLQQYSYLKLFQLAHEKCTESSRFTSDFEHLASSHISHTSMCCRHILAYVVTPLPNITKVLFKKNRKNPPCTGSRKQKS